MPGRAPLTDADELLRLDGIGVREPGDGDGRPDRSQVAVRMQLRTQSVRLE